MDKLTRDHTRDVTGPILRRNVEMTDLTEYLQMKQYHNYLNYHGVMTRLQPTRETHYRVHRSLPPLQQSVA
eukprot:5414743-Amphidinium_carterae.1